MDTLEEKKYKNVVDFYILTNKLKNIVIEGQSVTEKIYKSMILATAINSEHKIVDNIGIVLEMILLRTVREYYFTDLRQVLKNMDMGSRYTMDLEIVSNSPFSNNVYGLFAIECIEMEEKIESFFKLCDSYNINRINELSEKCSPNIFNDKKLSSEIINYLYYNRFLKKMIKSGWGTKKPQFESVSDHVVGTISYALGFASEFDYNIDLEKIVYMLCNHEIGKILSRGTDPFGELTIVQKQAIEFEAQQRVLGNLKEKNKILKLLKEFNERKTTDAIFAYYCSIFETYTQLKIYQDLYKQELYNNLQNTFNSSYGKKILQNMIEISMERYSEKFNWFGSNKEVYYNDPVFEKALDYVKGTKITID